MSAFIVFTNDVPIQTVSFMELYILLNLMASAYMKISPSPHMIWNKERAPIARGKWPYAFSSSIALQRWRLSISLLSCCVDSRIQSNTYILRAEHSATPSRRATESWDLLLGGYEYILLLANNAQHQVAESQPFSQHSRWFSRAYFPLLRRTRLPSHRYTSLMKDGRTRNRTRGRQLSKMVKGCDK